MEKQSTATATNKQDNTKEFFWLLQIWKTNNDASLS